MDEAGTLGEDQGHRSGQERDEQDHEERPPAVGGSPGDGGPQPCRASSRSGRNPMRVAPAASTASFKKPSSHTRR